MNVTALAASAQLAVAMTSIAHCAAAPWGEEKTTPIFECKNALIMDFIMRIGLGKHVDERKNEVVPMPMIVKLHNTSNFRAVKIVIAPPPPKCTRKKVWCSEKQSPRKLLRCTVTLIVRKRGIQAL